jgi:PPOX class probable F420-dependent enzyme
MTETAATSSPEDESTAEFRRRVRSKLRQSLVVWLVTTGRGGRPHPNPVWFHWEGEEDIEGSTVLVYTEQQTAKLRHIAANDAVALHFDTDAGGRDVVVLYGRAYLDPAAPAASDVPGYMTKYRGAIVDLGGTEEDFSADAAVRIVVDRVRGF